MTAKLLSVIFKRSWRMGEMPEDWRIVSITPVFRKGKEEELGNYRTFSLTSFPNKVLELLILYVVSKQVEEKVMRSS